MARQCSICGKQAVVAAKINDGTEIVNAYLCEPCLRAAAKLAEVRIVASAHELYPVNLILGAVPTAEPEEPDPLDDYDFKESEEEETEEEDIPKPFLESVSEENPSPKWKTVMITAAKTICICLATFLAFYIIDVITDAITKSGKNTNIEIPRTQSVSSSNNSTVHSTPSYSYSTPASSSNSPYIPQNLSDSLMSKMWDAAKEEVKKNLKSPSTAKFEKYYSDDVQFIKAKADDVETGGFNVSILAYVDSQNGFGAEIRTTFIVFFMVDKAGDFKIVDSMYY